jgi:phage-related minor tail protein
MFPELTDVSVELERIGDLADGVGKALSRAFRGAVLDGKSLNGMLGEVARSFSDIALKAALQPVGALVSSAVQGLFTAADLALAVKPFAKGGVLAAPTYFGLGQGLGLAGEAGAEAVLPLGAWVGWAARRGWWRWGGERDVQRDGDGCAELCGE